MNRKERINKVRGIVDLSINGKTIEEYINEKIEYCKKDPFEVLAERVKGDEIYVLGKHSKNYGFFEWKTFYRKVVLGKEDGEIIVNNSFKADKSAWIFSRGKMGKAKKLLEEAEEFKRLNIIDLEDILQDNIHIYQLTVETFEKKYNTEVEVIEIKGVKNVIEAKNDLHLRGKAYLLGADAILHYDKLACTGTPVRFVEK